VIIAISGLSGCGNTTASALVAKKLGLKRINYTLRDLAHEKGLPFATVQEKAGEEFPKWDLELDAKLAKMASNGNCVAASRLAIWLVPADLRVWLEAPRATRAKRIAKREGGRPDAAAVARRDAQNAARYKKLYGIDVSKHRQITDAELDAGKLTANQVAAAIVKLARNPPKRRKPNPWPARISKIIKRGGKK
jgi:cytidylate kinase